jgi:photosystem II stability/assembly factor-like uncharacterized protein
MKKATILFISIMLFLTSCSSTSYTTTQSKPPDLKTEILVTNMPSRLSNSKMLEPETEVVSSVGVKENLKLIYFFNESLGYFIGGNLLYRTNNGGRNWSKQILDIPKGAEIERMQFVNMTIGWMLVQKRDDSILNYKEDQFWLMQTKDGGKNWQIQKEGKEIGITHFSFTDEQHGWLAGVRFEGISIYTYYVLNTKDGGQNWEDVSEDLKRAATISETQHQEIFNDIISGITKKGNLVTAFTSSGLVLNTSDEGVNWQKVGAIYGEADQIVFHRFGLKNDSYHWRAGSVNNSEEGTWSVLTVENANNEWVRYSLGGVFFADVLYVEENKLFACGFVQKIKRGKETNEIRREGAIFLTKDSGRSWEIVYQNPDVNIINSLALTRSQNLWAVGEKGLAVKISFK